MASTDDSFDSRWIAVFGFALLFVLTVMLFVTPPASVYEMSIYDAYHWSFWVLLCGTFFLGFVVIVRSAYNDNENWRYGLLLVIAVISLLVFLPYFRGYTMFGRADPLSHIGFIKDIEKTGAISGQNIYPNFHALVLSLAYATGTKPMTAIMSVIGVGSLFFVVSSVTLLAVIYDRTRGLLTVPFVAVLVSIHPGPYGMGMMAVPFVLYLFVKDRQTNGLSVRLALVTALVGLVIYHPLITLYFLFVFAVYAIARFLYRNHEYCGQLRDVTDPAPSSQLLLTLFTVWYVQFPKILVRFERAVRAVINPGAGKSSIDSYSSTVTEYSPALIDLVRIALVRRGKAAILLGGGGLYAVFVALDTVRDRVEANVYQTTFVGAFALFSFLSALFLIGDFPVGPRSFSFANWFGALLCGPLFYRVLSSTDRKRTVKIALYAVLAVLIVVSTFGLYPSPHGIKENIQVTEKEIEGTEWFLKHRNEDTTHSEFRVTAFRFRDALYGRYTFSDDKLVSTQPPPIPSHFNYTEYDTLGASYEESRYLHLSHTGRMYYPELYPDYREFWRFTPADFERLERDPTVDHVYTNGGYDAYVVNGTGGN